MSGPPSSRSSSVFSTHITVHASVSSSRDSPGEYAESAPSGTWKKNEKNNDSRRPERVSGETESRDDREQI